MIFSPLIHIIKIRLRVLGAPPLLEMIILCLVEVLATMKMMTIRSGCNSLMGPCWGRWPLRNLSFLRNSLQWKDTWSSCDKKKRSLLRYLRHRGRILSSRWASRSKETAKSSRNLKTTKRKWSTKCQPSKKSLSFTNKN